MMSTSTPRLLMSTLLPSVVFIASLKKNSVNYSGAFWGFLVGFLLTLASYCFTCTLLTFFITSSKATKFKSAAKAKFEADFKEGGQRGFRQVFCNGGMATLLAAIYLLKFGPSERPVDFETDFIASSLSVGVMAIFAFGNADTWASELATVLSDTKPYLITTFRRVPVLTNGGITPMGTLLSAAGGCAVGLAHYLTLWCFANKLAWSQAPPQWPLILFGTLAGLIGSLLDSVVGATLQYSGLDKDGKVISDPSRSVKHISGMNLIGNSYVNFVITIFIGLVTPFAGKAFWALL